MALTRDIKELIRLAIYKSNLSTLYLKVREMRGQNVNHLKHGSLAARFAAIYDNKVWLNDRKSGSLSGLGSELESTGPIREQLPGLLQSLECKVLLDIGCGDFTWMKEVALPCGYIGIDVVPSVIEANNRSFGTESREFYTLDATSNSIPRADTVLCREVIFHLSFEDTWKLVENIRSSGAKYLLATNDTSLRINADILSGDFRLINLHRAPFTFPPPYKGIADNGLVANRQLSVWRVADLPSASSRRL